MLPSQLTPPPTQKKPPTPNPPPATNTSSTTNKPKSNVKITSFNKGAKKVLRGGFKLVKVGIVIAIVASTIFVIKHLVEGREASYQAAVTRYENTITSNSNPNLNLNFEDPSVQENFPLLLTIVNNGEVVRDVDVRDVSVYTHGSKHNLVYRVGDESTLRMFIDNSETDIALDDDNLIPFTNTALFDMTINASDADYNTLNINERELNDLMYNENAGNHITHVEVNGETIPVGHLSRIEEAAMDSKAR